MNELCCSQCGIPLTGGLDTYGSVGAETCFDCQFADVPAVDEREMELLETIRLATIELDAIEDFLCYAAEPEEDVTAEEDEREFFRGELLAAYNDLDEHRRRKYERVERWREKIGAA